MTYAIGERVLFTDFNNFADSINQVWSVGSFSQGYGQSAISSVGAGTKITALQQWASISTVVNNALLHQGSPGISLAVPSAGEKINIINQLTTNISTINSYRLYAAQQGITTATNSTNFSTPWNNFCYFYFTVDWGTYDRMRYFWNSGGQLGLTASHPGGSTIDNIISSLCSAVGTTWLSSVTPPLGNTVDLAGVTYSGVTKAGGSGSATINSGNGFWALNSGYQTLTVQSSGVGYYGGTFIQTGALTSGSQVQMYFLIDEVPNTATVGVGTTVSLTIRYPSTTRLTNTWGTAAVSTLISPNSV